MTAPKEHTIRDVCEMFGVSHMTVYNWRAGNKGGRKLRAKIAPRGERHRVLIPHDALMSFAKAQGLKPVARSQRKASSR